MKFWIENARELRWLGKFAKKNGFTIDDDIKEQFLPFGIILAVDIYKIYRAPSINKEDFILIKNFIKQLSNENKIVFCDGNTFAGPFQYSNDFEIGDKVRLVKAGQLYTTYARWFIENNIDLEIAAHYRYMDDGKDWTDKVGTIVACAPHSKTNSTILYCIEFKSWIDKPIYLANETAIVLEDTE